MRSLVVVTSGVSRIRNQFRETIEINSSVLQQHGTVLIQNGETRNSDRVESTRPVLNLHDFFLRL